MKAEIVKITARGAVGKVVAVLKKGGVAVLPTETMYGLAADATNEKAVARIFKIKRRKESKQLLVIVGNLKMAKEWFHFSRHAAILSRFFPAPLTLVVETKKKLAPSLSSSNSIAFRVPAHSFCREVSKKLGKPITATSANISGELAIFSFKTIVQLFGDEVDLIIDAGTLPRSKPSTIVNCIETPFIVRKGAFDKKLFKAL